MSEDTVLTWVIVIILMVSLVSFIVYTEIKKRRKLTYMKKQWHDSEVNTR